MAGIGLLVAVVLIPVILIGGIILFESEYNKSVASTIGDATASLQLNNTHEMGMELFNFGNILVPALIVLGIIIVLILLFKAM